MQTFTYAVKLTADKNDGGFVVSCRDIPEAITQGETAAEALDDAAGALQAALELRIEEALAIPLPTEKKRGEHWVSVPVATAMKAALYVTMQEQGVTKSDLARLLQLDEKEARRMLNPHHATKVSTLERALHRLGKRVAVVMTTP